MHRRERTIERLPRYAELPCKLALGDAELGDRSLRGACEEQLGHARRKVEKHEVGCRLAQGSDDPGQIRGKAHQRVRMREQDLAHGRRRQKQRLDVVDRHSVRQAGMTIDQIEVARGLAWARDVQCELPPVGRSRSRLHVSRADDPQPVARIADAKQRLLRLVAPAMRGGGERVQRVERKRCEQRHRSKR